MKKVKVSVKYNRLYKFIQAVHTCTAFTIFFEKHLITVSVAYCFTKAAMVLFSFLLIILLHVTKQFFECIIQTTAKLTRIMAGSIFNNRGESFLCYLHQYVCLPQCLQCLCILKIDYFFFNSKFFRGQLQSCLLQKFFFVLFIVSKYVKTKDEPFFLSLFFFF